MRSMFYAAPEGWAWDLRIHGRGRLPDASSWDAADLQGCWSRPSWRQVGVTFAIGHWPTPLAGSFGFGGYRSTPFAESFGSGGYRSPPATKYHSTATQAASIAGTPTLKRGLRVL